MCPGGTEMSSTGAYPAFRVFLFVRAPLGALDTKLERAKGVEPLLGAWRLPFSLNYARDDSARTLADLVRDSVCQHLCLT